MTSVTSECIFKFQKKKKQMLINPLYVIVCYSSFRVGLSCTPEYLFGKSGKHSFRNDPFKADSFLVLSLSTCLRKRPFWFLKPIISVRRHAWHETCLFPWDCRPKAKRCVKLVRKVNLLQSGNLAALTRSHLIGDHPWGLTKEQTTETIDPSPKTKGLRLYPRQWNLELAGAARLPLQSVSGRRLGRGWEDERPW